jgi:hypothetical protein
MLCCNVFTVLSNCTTLSHMFKMLLCSVYLQKYVHPQACDCRCCNCKGEVGCMLLPTTAIHKDDTLICPGIGCVRFDSKQVTTMLPSAVGGKSQSDQTKGLGLKGCIQNHRSPTSKFHSALSQSDLCDSCSTQSE